MAIRLDKETWQNVWRNTAEIMEQVEAEGFDPQEHTVMAVWLDPGDASAGEWVIASGDELLEDGFRSEREAEERLRIVEGYM